MVLLAFILFLSLVWVFKPSSEAADAVKTLLIPFITFAGAAFSIDEYSKNIRNNNDANLPKK
jgi:hypothetical protein